MSVWLSLAAAVTLSTASLDTMELRGRMGVNVSGCEFDAAGALCPNASDIAWYMDQGFSVLRIPFRGSLKPEKLYPLIDQVTARGGYVILDRHDFSWPKVSDQIAFWRKVIGPYAKNGHVMIDVMNEPKNFVDPTMPNGWMQWARDANQIIAGLRTAKLGNMILMEWPAYSAAYKLDANESAWRECESAGCALDRSGGLKDPLGRTLLSPHQYFDRWSTGTVSSCVAKDLGVARVAAAKRGYRLFLGETAFGSYRGVPDSCMQPGATAVAEIKSHPETWAGVAWWGGGRAWKEDYLFKLEPNKGTRSQAPASAYLKLISGR